MERTPNSKVKITIEYLNGQTVEIFGEHERIAFEYAMGKEAGLSRAEIRIWNGCEDWNDFKQGLNPAEKSKE